MRKINIAEVPEEPYQSPKGQFACVSRNISVALGRVHRSDKTSDHHAFDLELTRIPPGTSMCPYHSHTSQTEFYLVISGRGSIRDETGHTEVGPGDAFLFKPGEAHQLYCAGDEDFVFYIIADDPAGDACYYPDSQKISYPMAALYQNLSVKEASYYDGEE